MAYDATDFVVTDVLAPETAPNLRLLRDFLADLPSARFSYHESWPDELMEPGVNSIAIHECKTPVCILGWARVLSNGAVPLSRESMFQWMGLSAADGNDLCFGARNHRDVEVTQAVAVLDHYLATGKIDWSVA